MKLLKKYIKHCQLETIKNRINELNSLLSEYMKDATEDEKRAIPLFHESDNQTGLIQLLRDYKLVFLDWVSREDFEEVFEIQRDKVDDIIGILEDNYVYGDAVNDGLLDIIKKFKEE